MSQYLISLTDPVPAECSPDELVMLYATIHIGANRSTGKAVTHTSVATSSVAVEAVRASDSRANVSVPLVTTDDGG